MKKICLMLLILSVLVGCGTISYPQLEIFERPPKFPQTCDWIEGKKQCRPAVIWDHSSDSKSCLTQQEYITVTGHVVELNHVIDLYEIQVDGWNKQ